MRSLVSACRDRSCKLYACAWRRSPQGPSCLALVQRMSDRVCAFAKGFQVPPLAFVQGGPIYFVLCDFGPRIGRAYLETDPDKADRETALNLLIGGNTPVRCG